MSIEINERIHCAKGTELSVYRDSLITIVGWMNFLDLIYSSFSMEACSHIGERCRRIRRVKLLFLMMIICFILSYLCVIRTKISLIDSDLLTCPMINPLRIESGRKHFSQTRVIICGLIRSHQSHIKRLEEQLSPLGKLFADYAIVIVENDSKDNTRQELIQWTTRDSHVHIIGCDNQVNTIQSCNLSLPTTIKHIPEMQRIEKMVRLRNLYLDYIDHHDLLSQYDYVLVEDFDLTSSTYFNGLFSTGFHFDHDPDIDAICSNGILYNQYLGNLLSWKTYFDPYAHKDQANRDWSTTYNELWSSVFRQYSCEENLIPVQSCFSGRTIYRYRSIRGKRYRTYYDRNQQAICEHVGFHENLRKVYLNSEMIFSIFANNNR